MNTILYPNQEEYQRLLARPHKDSADLTATVSEILNHIRQEGDAAVLHYEEKFDKVSLSSLAVTDEEMQRAENLVAEELKKAILFPAFIGFRVGQIRMTIATSKELI